MDTVILPLQEKQTGFFLQSLQFSQLNSFYIFFEQVLLNRVATFALRLIKRCKLLVQGRSVAGHKASLQTMNAMQDRIVVKCFSAAGSAKSSAKDGQTRQKASVPQADCANQLEMA